MRHLYDSSSGMFTSIMLKDIRECSVRVISFSRMKYYLHSSTISGWLVFNSKPNIKDIV